jgi:hypothetical protein
LAETTTLLERYADRAPRRIIHLRARAPSASSTAPIPTKPGARGPFPVKASAGEDAGVDPPEVLGEGVPPEAAAETTAGVVGHCVVLVVLAALGVVLVVVLAGVLVVEVVVDAGTVVVVETTAAAVRGAVVVVVELVLDVVVVEVGTVVDVVLEVGPGVVVEVVLDVLVVHGVVPVVLVVELGVVVLVVLVVDVVLDAVVVLVVLVDVLVANPLGADADAAPTSPTEPHVRTAEIKMIPDAHRNNRSIRLSFPPEPAGPGRLVQALRRPRPIRPSNGTPRR